MLFACKKDSIPAGQAVAKKLEGDYSCLKYSFYRSVFQPEVYFDSIPHSMITIQYAGDNRIRVEDQELEFNHLYNGEYYFIGPVGSPKITHVVKVAENLSSFRYSVESMGMGGGAGYVYEWPE